MKLGIPILIIGVLMLLASIPFSIIMIVKGVFSTQEGNIISGLIAWSPLAGVIVGFILTTIGASRVFKN
jgi:hypothetical protein